MKTVIRIRLLAVLCTAGAALAAPALAQNAQHLAVQPVGQHSTLIDNQGKPIHDRDFANWAKQGLNPMAAWRVSNAGFYFNQCFGGGFLDDLNAVLTPAGVKWNGSAASQHNEFAYGQVLPAPGAVGPFTPASPDHPNPMGYWTRTLESAMVGTHYNASLFARAFDPWGVVQRAPFMPNTPFETGQIAFGNGGDTGLLFDAGLMGQRRAVIFAGFTDQMRHFNNADAIFMRLMALGYNAGDVTILFGDGQSKILNSGANDLPVTWVNKGPATPNALKNVMSNLLLGPNDQFLFYSTDHGGNTAIRGGGFVPGAGGGPPGQVQTPITMPAEIRDAMRMTTDNVPDLSLDYSGLTGDAEILFNGVSLGFLPQSIVPTTFSITLDESLILSDGLPNDVVIVNYASSFTVSELRLFSGAIPEGVVPAPGTGVLCGLGLILASRRRRA